MAKKLKYVAAPNQSAYPEQACSRAAWFLTSKGEDVRYKRLPLENFNAAYNAIENLNIPVHCSQKRVRGENIIKCFCHSPLSGTGKKRKARRGKRG